ncbi:MAG: tetratricopeptide repeat protein [Deltaproteobacteria bacterium]|nr:tetratricopeptide repeat protein [Deltaproteobacteria bacterium]
MSHLTDLLSKIKQADQKKEVPPGLSESISSIRRREPGKRRIVFFVVLISAALVLGLAASYLTDHLKGGPSESPSSSGPSASAQPPLQPQEALFDKEAAKKSESRTARDNSVTPDVEKKTRTEKSAPLSEPAPSTPRKAALSSDGSLKESYEERTDGKDSTEEKTGLFYRARSYELNGDLPKAVQTYEKVIEMEPLNYRAMNNIASLYIRMDRTKEALGYLEGSVRLKGDYVPALINLGIIQAKAGKAAEAESSFLKALSFDGSNRAALFNIAVLYENALRYDKAREYYRKLELLGDTEGTNGLKRLAYRP